MFTNDDGRGQVRLSRASTASLALRHRAHRAHSGADLIRNEITGRAMDLAHLLHLLLPADQETAGLLALLLVHQARRETHGRLLRLEEQGPHGMGPRADRRGRPAHRRSATRGASRAFHP
ncbi:DUF6596 domain-containing protein [Nocardia sp. GCM10030253]|uniref:DUF6596 domain-containing protein n=1 Tax=Nocardia sp. GCM10030253 TaxID=3273404 RepID=UPI003632BA0A